MFRGISHAGDTWGNRCFLYLGGGNRYLPQIFTGSPVSIPVYPRFFMKKINRYNPAIVCIRTQSHAEYDPRRQIRTRKLVLHLPHNQNEVFEHSRFSICERP